MRFCRARATWTNEGTTGQKVFYNTVCIKFGRPWPSYWKTCML